MINFSSIYFAIPSFIFLHYVFAHVLLVPCLYQTCGEGFRILMMMNDDDDNDHDE